MEIVPTSLFGYIRNLSGSATRDALQRVEAFLTVKTSREIATIAMAVIKAPDENDVAILKKLREIMVVSSTSSRKPEAEPRCCDAGREKSRLKDVAAEMGLIETALRERDGFAYLDIGCAEGHITAAFVEALEISPERAHACDVVLQQPNSAFTFTKSEIDHLPYPSESFDLATMFMAAHHFADAGAMFLEARRVMRMGGCLLIRDHNCTDLTQWFFYDVVHALYACVLGSESTPEEFMDLYAAGGFAHYRPREDWIRLACECGFEMHPGIISHGPVIRGKYGNDRFDSFYVLLRACA
jgi:SAM-dependent methyltransferase